MTIDERKGSSNRLYQDCDCKVRMDLIRLVVGIVAAFGSTFSGVWLAHFVERNERMAQREADFRNVVEILRDGCELEKMQQIEQGKSAPIIVSDLLTDPIQNNILLLGNLMEDEMWTLLVRLSQLESAQTWHNRKLEFYSRTFSSIDHIDLTDREKVIKERTEKEIIDAKVDYSRSLQNVCDVFGSTLEILDAN